MEVASGKNRQNTKENAKIWQFLLKATKLVSLNWKMTPNYSVYFGLMGKRFLSEKCCGLYWNEGCSLDLGSKNSGYIGMRVILECGFNWKEYGSSYFWVSRGFMQRTPTGVAHTLFSSWSWHRPSYRTNHQPTLFKTGWQHIRQLTYFLSTQ